MAKSHTKKINAPTGALIGTSTGGLASPPTSTMTGALIRSRPRKLVVFALAGLLLAAGFLSIYLHPANSVISFDEGFHGGGALYYTTVFRQWLGLEVPTGSAQYLYGEFKNGITLYPPLWALKAALLGLIAEPTLLVFRVTTTLFYLASLVLAYWLIWRVYRRPTTALAAALLLASIPIVFIYSNLMMLEIPLLFSIGLMVGSFFLFSRGTIKRTRLNIIILAGIFLAAPHAKLPAFPVALAIIVGFIILASLLFYRQRYYRHFLKWELLVLPVLSLLSLAFFVYLEKWIFQENMIDFFTEQSRNQSPGSGNNLTRLWQTLNDHSAFYLRDFLNMPTLSIIWLLLLGFGTIRRRDDFSLLLLIWIIGVYATFSAVMPQVPQYIAPIYLPIALGAALGLDELSHWLSRWLPGRQATTGLLIGSLALTACQIYHIPKSETYAWFSHQTGQAEAAQAIAGNAKNQDRVLSWNDGNSFAVRAAGLKKELQIVNAIGQMCPQAMLDSAEWAIVVNQPPLPSALDLQVLSSAGWQEYGRYGANQNTVVYQNTQTAWPLMIEAEATDFGQPSQLGMESETSQTDAPQSIELANKNQPAFWGCYRPLPLGDYEAVYVLRAEPLPGQSWETSQPLLNLEYSPYMDQSEFADQAVMVNDLPAGQWQSIILPFQRHKMNQLAEFRLIIAQAGRYWLDRIEVRPLDR